MADFPARLDGLQPIILELMQIKELRVSHLGFLLGESRSTKANLGLQNAEADLPVVNERAFPICSLTKGLATSTIVILVEKGN